MVKTLTSMCKLLIELNSALIFHFFNRYLRLFMPSILKYIHMYFKFQTFHVCWQFTPEANCRPYNFEVAYDF